VARSWHTRYRRIIDAYRIALMEVSPSKCNEVDDRMWVAGEKWLVDEAPIDPDALMTAREIATRFGLKPYDIRNWSNRHPEALPAHRIENRVLFRLGDVLWFQVNH
jgi:hypothetical protein